MAVIIKSTATVSGHNLDGLVVISMFIAWRSLLDAESSWPSLKPNIEVNSIDREISYVIAEKVLLMDRKNIVIEPVAESQTQGESPVHLATSNARKPPKISIP